MNEKYVVKKSIDLFEFMKAHKEDKGWELLKDSCLDFQHDVRTWVEVWELTNGYFEGEIITNTGEKGFTGGFMLHLVKYGFLEPVKPAILYKRSQKFMHKNWLYHYILAGVSYSMSLVNMITGNVWTRPIVVRDAENITEEEFAQICGGHPENFRLIEE